MVLPFLGGFCVGSGGLALALGRRPRNWRFVIVTGAIGLVLVWPTAGALFAAPKNLEIFWTRPEDRTPLWMFALQWWPVFLPWLALCFAWFRLGAASRYVLVALPLLLIAVELITFTSRHLTTEKMWGQLYGTGLVVIFPLIFQQRGLSFRLLSGLLLLFSFGCFASWLRVVYYLPVARQDFCRLSGDADVQNNPQARRLLQVLRRLHGATILPGKAYWSYNAAPTVVTFSENRCFIAYTYQEWNIGRGDEADYRARLTDSFYDGAMPDPLPFLRSNGIAAVLIWPEDKIPLERLRQFEAQLRPDYAYIDCQAGGADQAGVFLPLERRAAPLVSATRTNVSATAVPQRTTLPF